jgi:hypothetical protein
VAPGLSMEMEMGRMGLGCMQQAGGHMRVADASGTKLSFKDIWWMRSGDCRVRCAGVEICSHECEGPT